MTPRWRFWRGGQSPDLRAPQSLPAALAARVPAARAALRAREAGIARQPLAEARLVVVDLETSGLRADRDRLLALAAVEIRARRVHFDGSLLRTLRQAQPSDESNILVHRIGAQAQRGGEEPAACLLDLLEFAGESPWFAFRAGFDNLVLRRHLREHLGIDAEPGLVDIAALLGGLLPGTPARTFEEWTQALGLPQERRHDALADAAAAAALLLVVLERAHRLGLGHCGDLAELEHAQEWLGR